VQHQVQGEMLDLLPQKAIWWKAKRTLILADLHLGKVQHFRKAGFAVPQKIFEKDLALLNELIVKFEPEKVVVVGDMFHSIANSEVHIFEIWREQFNQVNFILVKGNHDVLAEKLYCEMKIEVHEFYSITPFSFSHHLASAFSRDEMVFSGHIHPGVLLKGKGKQVVRLACFYFTPNYVLLPAFGNFTGLEIITPEKNSKIFAIVENQVIEL
jgi:DNA ligase-associated metallophosphoesterase